MSKFFSVYVLIFCLNGPNAIAGQPAGILVVAVEPSTKKPLSCYLYVADSKNHRLLRYEIGTNLLDKNFMPSDRIKLIAPEEANLPQFDVVWKKLQTARSENEDSESKTFSKATSKLRKALEDGNLHLVLLLRSAPGIYESVDGTLESPFQPEELLALELAFKKTFTAGRFRCNFTLHIGNTFFDPDRASGSGPAGFRTGPYSVKLKEAVQRACDECTDQMPSLEKKWPFREKKWNAQEARCGWGTCRGLQNLRTDDFFPPLDLIPAKCENLPY